MSNSKQVWPFVQHRGVYTSLPATASVPLTLVPFQFSMGGSPGGLDLPVARGLSRLEEECVWAGTSRDMQISSSRALGPGPWFPSFQARGELWGSLWYIFLGIPIIRAMVAGLSYTDPRRLWCWGLLPMMAQVVWMFETQRFGNLWPLGIDLLALAIPPIATASLGALIRR